MRIHYLQHAEFEIPSNVKRWADERKHPINGTLLFKNEKLPDINEFDLLVIMGGPMNIYEEDKYSFLNEEKKFIEKAIKNDKKVLGICLGSQLLADVLGAKVIKNRFKEIGWFPVNMTEDSRKYKLFDSFPDKFTAFHWHGDTFAIPDGAVCIAQSKACANQGFIYENKVIGLQFHIEPDEECIKTFLKYGKDELQKDNFVQTETEILSNVKNVLPMYELLKKFMDKI